MVTLTFYHMHVVTQENNKWRRALNSLAQKGGDTFILNSNLVSLRLSFNDFALSIHKEFTFHLNVL